MTLRLRLLLAFGYLASLVLIVSVSAMFTFLHLSSGIDVILTNNFRTIEASMEMIEALERIDSETLATLLEREPADLEEERLVATTFLQSLAKAEANVTEEHEPAILARIHEEFDVFLEARDELLASRPERPLAAYQKNVFPLFGAVKAEVFALLEVNHDAMVAADRRAKATAVESSAWLGVLVTIALVSFVFMAHGLRSKVLKRLAWLRRDIERIGTSQTLRRVHCPGHDEFASIARSINRILDRYEDLKADSEQRLTRERQLIAGVVDGLDGRVALLDLDGNLIAGSFDDADLRRDVASRLIGQQASSLDSSSEARRLDVAGTQVEIRPIHTRRGQPLGWLARVAS